MITHSLEKIFLGVEPSEIRTRFLRSFKNSFPDVDWNNLSTTEMRVWEEQSQAIEKIEALPESAQIHAKSLINNHGVGKDDGEVAHMPSYALREGDAMREIDSGIGAIGLSSKKILKEVGTENRTLKRVQNEENILV